jgi:hypothetical protein
MEVDMVYIVLKNGKVDEVFSSREAAKLHRKNLTKKWSLSEIVEREVKEI